MEKNQLALAEKEATRRCGPAWLKRIKKQYKTSGKKLTSGDLFWAIGDVLIQQIPRTL